jgi:hypothetical protein
VKTAECGVCTAWIRRREGLARQRSIADAAVSGVPSHDTFVLPAAGAAAPIRYGGRTVGHLILIPQAGHTSLTVRRSVVFALAATVASALAASEDLAAS